MPITDSLKIEDIPRESHWVKRGNEIDLQDARWAVKRSKTAHRPLTH